MLTVIFSVAGLIPILVDKGVRPITDKKYHPLLGLTVLIIAFLQPVLAYFRPGKDAKFRPVFKYVHTALGYASIILATASIFLTKELEVLRECPLSIYWWIIADWHSTFDNIVCCFRRSTCQTGASTWWLPSPAGWFSPTWWWPATPVSRTGRSRPASKTTLWSRLAWTSSLWGSLDSVSPS